MKKKIRNPIIIITSIILLSGAFSALFYNIFCKLEQTIDWNAINAIASIVMTIVTAVAVYVAIYLPKEERLFNSKIELFNKRFEAYYMLYNFYWNIIVTGKPIVGNDFYKKANSRLRFLIDPEDWEKIQLLTKKILDRIDHKVASNPHDFEDELNELRNIFDKYLSLSEID